MFKGKIFPGKKSGEGQQEGGNWHAGLPLCQGQGLLTGAGSGGLAKVARCQQGVVGAMGTSWQTVLELSPRYLLEHVWGSGQGKHWPGLCKRNIGSSFAPENRSGETGGGKGPNREPSHPF